MTTAPRRTFYLIQALRGLAALWVMLFHIEKGEYITGVTANLPGWLGYAVFGYGSAGVAIFFVLSGFVISHSLTGRGMDARGYGRFIARRSLRLDPPYWVSIALTVLVGAIYARAKGAPFAPPAATTVIGHIVYLQDILGLPKISVIYWTLAYEVQFYLILAAAWWGMTALIRRGTSEAHARLLVMTPLSGLALVSAALAREWVQHGLFVNLWHGFFLGVLAYEVGVNRRGVWVWSVLCLVTLLGTLQTDTVFGTPCAITALALVIAARTGYLERGLSTRPWQFFGRISYSLYLIHVPVLTLGFAIWGRVIGRGNLADLAGLMVVGALIIIGSAMFWWSIERPSHALSARLFRTRSEPVAGSRF